MNVRNRHMWAIFFMWVWLTVFPVKAFSLAEADITQLQAAIRVHVENNIIRNHALQLQEAMRAAGYTHLDVISMIESPAFEAFIKASVKSPVVQKSIDSYVADLINREALIAQLRKEQLRRGEQAQRDYIESLRNVAHMQRSIAETAPPPKSWREKLRDTIKSWFEISWF